MLFRVSAGSIVVGNLGEKFLVLSEYVLHFSYKSTCVSFSKDSTLRLILQDLLGGAEAWRRCCDLEVTCCRSLKKFPLS